MRTVFIMVFCLLVISQFLIGQETTTKDIIFLVELGVSDDEIINHITKSSMEFKLTEEQIQQLKDKGVSVKVLQAMGVYNSRLSVDEIIRLSEAKIPEEEIIKIIADAESVPNYNVKEWIKLRRANVSIKIIQALKKKLRGDTFSKVTPENILDWHSKQVSAKEMLKRIREQGLDLKKINSDSILKLKRERVASEVVRYVAEKYLIPNPQSLDIPEEEEVSDVPEEENTAEEAQPYIRIYPGSTDRKIKKPQVKGNRDSFKRSFYCTPFSCPGSLEEVEVFYRSHYDNMQISKVRHLDVFRVLKLKFPKELMGSPVEIIHYSLVPEEKSRFWSERLKIAKKGLAAKKMPLRKINKEVSNIKKSYRQKKLSKEHFQRLMSNLEGRWNGIVHSKSYWNVLAMEQVIKKKTNILLVVQPSGAERSLVAEAPKPQKKEATIDLSISENTLAKDIPGMVYPNSVFVEHHKIEEGLKRTSRQRSMYRTLYLCPGTFEQIMTYYKTNYQDTSTLKLDYLDCFRIVKIKFDMPQINSQIEIAFYSLMIGRKSVLWKSRQKIVKNRLAQLEIPLKTTEKEIAALKKLFKEKKISRDSLDIRMEYLNRNRYLHMNTPSYWDFNAMDKVMAAKKNLLLITQVKKN